MTDSAPPSLPQLIQAEAAFMQSGLSLIAASRNAQNHPSSALVLACRILEQGQQINIVVRPSQCPEFLRDVREQGVVAFACSQVGTHRSLQIKSRRAKVGVIDAGDIGEIVGQTSAFIESVVSFDHIPEAVMRAYTHFELHDLAVISFRPDEIYTQTPGPNAGAKIA